MTTLPQPLTQAELVPLTPQHWRTRLEQTMQAEQQRMTATRRLVLDWITAAEAPFSAETLVDDLTNRQGIISRPTVYRAFEWLRRTGWIGRIHRDGAEHTYARLLPGHYHHAVCTACGLTLVFGGCDLTKALLHTLAAHGFTVQGHLLELYGQCVACQQAYA
jgi:Fe2+ or Zn2+ uptake regulation protein